MLKNYLKEVGSSGRKEPIQFKYNDTIQDPDYLSGRLKDSDIDCIILFVQAPAAFHIIHQLRQNHLNQPVYATLNQLDENKIPQMEFKYYENVEFVSPELLAGKQGIAFSEKYRKKYGNIPGAVAACAFDGMNLLIEAIRKAGTERENIQKALRDIKYEGVTGTIQFDEKGNRKGAPVFVEIKNGIP
jgi:branched-chain amino acid transport system substrate-binding protein